MPSSRELGAEASILILLFSISIRPATQPIDSLGCEDELKE